MPPLLNFIIQNPIIIYIALAVGLPLLGRMIKGIKDKRAAAERKRLMHRAEMEALRTGRAAGSAEYTPQRPNAPQPNFPATEPMSQAPASPQPQTGTRAGQPRYVQLPGGVILELPPAPTAPTTPQAPRPAAPRPTPRPAQRPAQRPTPRPVQRQTPRPAPPPAPAARTPARTQPQQRPPAPRQQNVQTTQQAVARRQAAETHARAQHHDRDREERAAEERRRQLDDRQRAAREERQRQQTADIVAEAYRQDAPATDRTNPRGTVNVGGMKLKARDLRRVLLLREIMDPPIAMRDEMHRDPLL